jgi:hypothetical protein
MSRARAVLTLVVAAGSEPRTALMSTARSLLGQTDPRWELLVCATASGAADLAREPDLQDERVRILDADPAGSALGQALGHLADGFVASVEAGGELMPAAVETIAAALDEHPQPVAVFYTDEVVVDGPEGTETRYKPAWSPERLRGHSYPGRLCGVSVAAAREAGGVRDELAAAAEHDLILRVSERAGAIIRVPHPLYRGPQRAEPDESSWDAQVRAVQEHLTRVGIPGVAERGVHAGSTRVVRQPCPGLEVCVVIATQGEEGLVWGERRVYVVDAVRSVLAHADGLKVHVVVVHTAELDAAVLRSLREVGGDRLVLECWPGEFDAPGMFNRGALLGIGDVLVLLEDRVEVDTEDFLGRLVAPLLDGSGIGMTGPRVLAANGTHAGAGVALYDLRSDPMFRGRLDEDPVREGVLTISRECSALLPTCLALTRRVFEEVGGLNERLTTQYHVDLALKVARLTLSRVWVQQASLRHFAAVPARVVGKPEYAVLRNRWFTPQVDNYMPHFGQWRVRRRAEAERGGSGPAGDARHGKRQRGTPEPTSADPADDPSDDVDQD